MKNGGVAAPPFQQPKPWNVPEMDILKLAELQELAGDLFNEDELKLIAAADQPAPPEPETPTQGSIQAGFAMAFDEQNIMAELSGLIAPALAAHDRRQAFDRRRAQSLGAERKRAAAAWTPTTRTDRRGVTWDYLHPGTSPQAGDEIDDDGVWRPRPSVSRCTSRYVRPRPRDDLRVSSAHP